MPAKSKAQQRLMGQAYAVKKGELDPKDIDSEWRDEIVKLADSMTLKQLKDFAKTPHKDLKESKRLEFIELYEDFLKRINK